MFKQKTKIVTLATIWAVMVAGLTLADIPQIGLKQPSAEASVFGSVDVSRCKGFVTGSIGSITVSRTPNSLTLNPQVEWQANLNIGGRNGASITGATRNVKALQGYRNEIVWPTVNGFQVVTGSRHGVSDYVFSAAHVNSHIRGDLRTRIAGTTTNLAHRFNGGSASASNRATVSAGQSLNFRISNWIGSSHSIDNNQLSGNNPTILSAQFSQEHRQYVMNRSFSGRGTVNYRYTVPDQTLGPWTRTNETRLFSGTSQPPRATSTVEWRFERIVRIGGFNFREFRKWTRSWQPTLRTINDSCEIRINATGNRSGAWVEAKKPFETTSIRGTPYGHGRVIGDKAIQPTLSQALLNQSSRNRSQVAAPYAGEYKDRMCRIEGDVASLPNSTSKSQTLTSSFIQANGGNFWTVARAIASPHVIDASATLAANGWARGYPAPYFGGIQTINAGGNQVQYRTTAFAYNFVTAGPFAFRTYPAAGQTLRVVYSRYDSTFAGCYTYLTGSAPSTVSTSVRVSRKLDLTGNHPAKISYVFAGHNISGPSPTTPVAVQCLPEAVGLTGITVYDRPQGPVTSGNYQNLDNSNNWQLARDNNVLNIPSYYLPFASPLGSSQDRWTTALSPIRDSIAGGARNPSEGSIACRYNKQNSATFLDWSRTNPYLPISRGPVYVDDTINVSSAYAQKVSDPGRIITGNVTVRLTGPGYSQTRSCSNPCNPFSFPPVPNAGTYTLSASWGGDSGLNGSSTSTSFTVLKYDTRLSFDRIQRTLNGETITDFTSTRPVPVNNLHLQNTSIPWIPTVPPGDMGSGTIRVEVQQKRFGQSNWSNFTDFRLTNPNCLMSANPCPEFGIRFEREAEYRVRITYEGNRKYNASVAPSASGWSNPFWVYEDFKCFIPQNADGDSIRVYHLENNRAVSKFRGTILRDGNNIVAEYPVLIDGRHFTGIVRLGGLRTNTMFEGTPRADGELVRVFQIPVLSNSEMLNLLQGRYDNSFTEARILPNQPQQGLYRFNNVENYFSFPVNTNPDGTARKNAFRVFEVSDVGGSLKIMQEITIFDSIFYQNGTRRSGSISCEPEDSPQSGPLVMRKATVID